MIPWSLPLALTRMVMTNDDDDGDEGDDDKKHLEKCHLGLCPWLLLGELLSGAEAIAYGSFSSSHHLIINWSSGIILVKRSSLWLSGGQVVVAVNCGQAVIKWSRSKDKRHNCYLWSSVVINVIIEWSFGQVVVTVICDVTYIVINDISTTSGCYCCGGNR